MDTILILGASGLVGKELYKVLTLNYDVYGTYYNSKDLLNNNKMFKFNVNNTSEIKSLLNKVKPDIVVSMLRGEFDNQLIVHAHIAEYLKANGGKVYYGSTANVFDNLTYQSHSENDTPDAKSDYGKFKLDCERKLQRVLNDDCIILRLPMMFSKERGRFPKLLQDIENNRKIDLYSNLFINTNTDVMLSKQIKYIIDYNLRGIFHLGTTDTISHSDFYTLLLHKLKIDYPNIDNKEISRDDYYLSLKSIRDDIPNYLKITNNSLIDYLVNKQ